METSVVILFISLVAFYGECDAACVSYLPYMNSALTVFSGADRNRDGVLQRSELDDSFSQYDSNHDNRIASYEYADFLVRHIGECMRPLAEELFKDYDFDGDSYLEPHDFDAYYAKLDTNSDMIVSSGEFIQHWVTLFTTTEPIHSSWPPAS